MTTRTGSAAWRAAHDAAAWAGLGPVPLVELKGPDARRFANGMFTNNVRDLGVGRAHETAGVDDRGRVTALLDLLCVADDRFLVHLDGTPTDDFLAHYGRYVVFDDVELTDVTGTVHLVTVQGPDAAAATAHFDEADGVHRVVRPRSMAGGVDLWIEAARFDEVATRLGDVPRLTPAELEGLRVLAGQVRWPADMAHRRLPHELGLRERLLHFEKGCYLGQESINRIDVMGNVRRALVVLTMPRPLPPGTPVFLDDKPVGHLTSPVDLPEGAAALAVVRKPADVPGSTLLARDGDTVHDVVVGRNLMESVAAALTVAEERLRAHGLTGGQAFDALVNGLRERLGDAVVATPAARTAVRDLPLDEGGGLDLLGLAYERFFADLFKGRRGQYFTPPPIARLLVAVAAIEPGEDVLDPTCGAAGLLVEAARRRARVRGIELDPRLARLARLHLRLAGVSGDVAQADFFAADPEPADVVVANPPFSVEIRDQDVLDRYPGTRGSRRALSDHLFVEALAHWVRPGGRAAVVLPFSVLTNRSTAALRDRIDAEWERLAICALPEGVFRPFGGAAGRACLLWLRRRGAHPLPLRHACRWADLTDPGYDVRSVHVRPTPSTQVAQLVAGQGWSVLEAGRWAPGGVHTGGVPLRDVASVRRTTCVPSRGPSPTVRVADLADSDRRTGELRPRTVPAASVSGARLELRDGDVLVSRLRPELGNVAVVPGGSGGLVGSPEWIALEVTRWRHWVLHVLRTPTWREQLPLTGGQTRPRTHPEAVLDSRVPLPADEVAGQVEALSRHLHASRLELGERLDALQAAVDAYVGGELDEAGLAAAVAQLREPSG